MAVFEVWDPSGEIPSTIFQRTENATQYREKLEKKHKRLFRIRKIFSQLGEKRQVDDHLEVVFEQNAAEPGDIITSEKGMLVRSIYTGKIYKVKKIRVEEDGTLIALDKEGVI